MNSLRVISSINDRRIRTSMKNWTEAFLKFWKSKLYMAALALTAAGSYGFLITHQTVGIDDTPYAYYFEEGLVAIVGRWVLFLLNKVLHISDFSPFLMDFAGVLILMAAATVWCTLLYSVLKDRLPMWGYVFFACFFIANPLLSEVFTYYLHNGVAIGYLCSGISLICFREGLMRLAERRKGERCAFVKWGLPFAGAAVFLWIAIGCYESLMIVWLLGVLLVLLTERITGLRRGVFGSLGLAALVAAAGIVLRSIMIVLVTKGFGLEYLQGEAVQRSLTEMVSWLFKPGAQAEFNMVLKRIFIMYGVFAYAYYPIFIFVLAAAVMLCFGVVRSIQKRDVWIILLTMGCFVASFLLIVIEGKTTLYRSAQFLPVICAYGALLSVYAAHNFGAWLRGTVLRRRVQRGLNGALAVVLSVLLFNQCSDMNKWFYVDYLKYEDAKNTMNQIAYELEKSFDISKPVIFTGTYDLPMSIVEDAYVRYNTPVFYKMKRLADMVDSQLLEKYNRGEYGVWVAQTPALSVLDWGRYAFDSDAELVRFFSMHGHTLQPLLDISLYEEAEVYSLDLPEFPAEGSIVDRGEYIIVHF